MKKRLALFLLLCGGALCASAHAQEIALESVHARLQFPDAWQVFTPATLPVYAAILQGAGMDPEAMRVRFESDGVVAEGWSEDYSDSYRLLVGEDDRSRTLFDISRATGAQRRQIAASFTDAKAWKLTNIRFPEAEWQKHVALGDVLLLRYNELEGEEIAARGLRYFTIRNGRNYILDWSVGARRVTNKDLARFEEILNGFSFTELENAPPIPIQLALDAALPQESGDGVLRITGVTEPDAGLVLANLRAGQEPEVLSVGGANSDGKFTIDATLAAEGTYNLSLTASKAGYADASVTGALVFQLGLLPINLDNLPAEPIAEDTFTLKGRAPAGTVLQFLEDTKAIKRTVGHDGRFSVKFDTSEPRAYKITLSAIRKGLQERRIAIEFTRERTEEDALRELTDQAKRITYAQLIRNPEAYVGELLVFTGEVMSVEAGDGVWFIRLDVSRSAKQSWQMVVACQADPEVAQADRITCYARGNAAYTEQDAAGKDVLIPSLTLVSLEK